MTAFINYTAFPALRYEGMDQHDDKFHIVVARITYNMVSKEKKGPISLIPATEQPSLHYTDVHYGDLLSSVEYESDLAPYKPMTDVIINATAFSPSGKPAPCFDVAVKAGKHRQSLRIYGPRFWVLHALGWELSPPAPIDSLDIRYEYASGGSYDVDGKSVASSTNPSGMGWYPDDYLKTVKENRLPAPQIELPEAPVTKINALVRPGGYGFFGKSWSGRIEYAGTYDSAWIKERHPYLPEDFTFNYWCGAHPSLQITHPLPGGQVPVELHGLVPVSECADQTCCFNIPVETFFVFASTALAFGATKEMLLDTIVIDMRCRQVFCTYRITLADELQIQEVQLRYIAQEDRDSQKALAMKLKNDPTSQEFLPLPPSIINR